MTDLNDFIYTDGTDDVMAAYVNNLLAATIRSEYKNVETLSATRTLTDADTPIQRFDCGGASRIVLAPDVDLIENHLFWVVNASDGGEVITLKSFSGVTTLATVAMGQAALIMPDGAGGYLALGVVDLSIYLLKSGLSEWDEQVSDPTTPATGKWKLYFKSGGLYIVDDAGVVTGALGAGGGGSLPPAHLYGLKMANNATDPTNDIDIGTGGARDTTNTSDMTLAAALTGKQLDVAWAVGSSAGLLDQGTIANGTYHIHLVKRLDTGVVDVIGSLSHDASATVTMTIASPGVVTWGVTGNGHGLVVGSPFKFSTTGALPTGVTAGTQYYVIAAGLTETTFQFSASNGGAAVNTSGTQSGVHTGLAGPKLPTSYTYFRRIGSIVRESAAIVGFVQDGDNFIRKAPISSVSATNPGITAVTRTLHVPVGVRVEAIVSVAGNGTTNTANPGSIYLSDLSVNDTTASVDALSFYYYNGAAVQSQLGGNTKVFTNKSAQIRSRLQISAASTTLYINTHGWIDTRGK